MENEYATFGLPSDPANQPIQPHQVAAVKRGWFFRNLRWLLPAALLQLTPPLSGLGVFGIQTKNGGHGFRSPSPIAAERRESGTANSLSLRDMEKERENPGDSEHPG
jgi:hypothetical protein